MSAPTSYDPVSPNEQAPPLPSAPPVRVNEFSVLQPPLSRRGTGPGLILLLPDEETIKSSAGGSGGNAHETKPLDPEPMQKWAEEGFAVVAVTLPKDEAHHLETASNFWAYIQEGVQVLEGHPSVDTRDNFGLIIYDSSAVQMVHEWTRSLRDVLGQDNIACIVTFSNDLNTTTWETPHLAHTSTLGDLEDSSKRSHLTIAAHPDTRPNFVFPSSPSYDAASASLAHTKTLVFLRKHLGGPNFDLEAIWEEHTYWEFEKRSVAHTMATMVEEPYVNHVPTMTGGMGRDKLTAFYRDHFIFCNPQDTALKPISRTVGPDRIVDEFIFSCTHNSHIPWLLPRVPPTNKLLTIPMVAVVNVRGDRLYHEHIWWDQATVLRQAGILPTHLPLGGDGNDTELLKLPVAGSECARLLVDERDGKSNAMMDM